MDKPILKNRVPAHISRAMLMRIREAQKVQDRERVLRQRYKHVEDTTQFYPGPELMAAMIFIASAALIIALAFGVVTVAVIYAPAIIIDSITIIVLRQIAGLQYESYWRRFCLMWCFIDAHLVLVATIVPVIDLGFTVSYRLQESPEMTSSVMRSMTHLFRHYLAGDVCVLILAVGCTVYAMLTCLLCYATRGPIYTSYAVIDLSKLDEA